MNCINKEIWNYKQNKHQPQLNLNFVYWHGCLHPLWEETGVAGEETGVPGEKPTCLT